MDGEWFLKSACNDSPNQIADRIIESDYKVVKLPIEFDNNKIIDKHLNLINNLMKSKLYNYEPKVSTIKSYIISISRKNIFQ